MHWASNSSLCWQNPPSTSLMVYTLAVGTWGGYTDWELPNIGELVTLVRGCQNGVEGNVNVLSQCSMSPAGCLTTDTCTASVSCFGCDEDAGPTAGCYWPTGVTGDCYHYWSTSAAGTPGYYWRMSFRWGDMSSAFQSDGAYYARCVRR